MTKYKVEVEGTKSMLQNKFDLEAAQTNIKETKKKLFDAEEDVKKKIYLTQEGKAFIPSEHFLAAIINGGKGRKLTGDKTVLSYHLKRIMTIDQEQILIHDKDGNEKTTWDEIDIRRVVLSARAGCLPCARPMFYKGWKASFTIELIEDFIPKDVFLSVIEKGGSFGIGDYRPRFGGFMVTSFQEV